MAFYPSSKAMPFENFIFYIYNILFSTVLHNAGSPTVFLLYFTYFFILLAIKMSERDDIKSRKVYGFLIIVAEKQC